VAFPHKQAVLMRLTREAWEGPSAWAQNVSYLLTFLLGGGLMCIFTALLVGGKVVLVFAKVSDARLWISMMQKQGKRWHSSPFLDIWII
jgi:hypothetical protein